MIMLILSDALVSYAQVFFFFLCVCVCVCVFQTSDQIKVLEHR